LINRDESADAKECAATIVARRSFSCQRQQQLGRATLGSVVTPMKEMGRRIVQES
jgi:hypothetical protein